MGETSTVHTCLINLFATKRFYEQTEKTKGTMEVSTTMDKFEPTSVIDGVGVIKCSYSCANDRRGVVTMHCWRLSSNSTDRDLLLCPFKNHCFALCTFSFR